MDGKTTHASYVAWIGMPSDPNPINDHLWNAGCVFYVRTTGPQTLMALECDNNIYGRTVNPWNRNLTCGGSSGGEGALVAFRGSVWVSFHSPPSWIFAVRSLPSKNLADINRALEATLVAV